MTQYPPLNIYSEDDEPIGEAMLEKILDKGLLHRVIHVVIQDEKGDMLLQLRSPNVSTNPNKWDFATAGYVDPGETYEQTAKREIKEELGLSGFELEDLGVIRQKDIINGREVNRLAGHFKTILPKDTKLILDEEEVTEVKWFNPEEIKLLIHESPDKIASHFRLWLENNYLSDENNEH